MYRIKLTNGDECTLAGAEALARAVHDGTVTADCSIFHQRAGQWLSIATHPHFQRALQSPPPAAATPAPAAQRGPARARPALDASALDRTLELLDLLPEPMPASSRAKAVEPPSPLAPARPAAAPLEGLDVIEPAPSAPDLSGLPLITDDADALGAGRTAEPLRLDAGADDAIDPALLDERMTVTTVDASSENVSSENASSESAASESARNDAASAAAAEFEITPAAPPVEAPRPRGRSRDLDFVYVPETPSRRRAAAAPPVTPPVTPSVTPPVLPAPPAAAAAATVKPSLTLSVTASAADDDFDLCEPETATASDGEVATPRHADGPVEATAPIHAPIAIGEPGIHQPAAVEGRAGRAFDFSPLTESHGGHRKATILAMTALVAVGVTLGAWRPWNAKPAAAAPGAAPAAATIVSTQAATTAEPATAAAHAGAASGFGADDKFRKPARPAHDSSADVPLVDAPTVDAPKPGVPRVDLGALAVTSTASAGLPLSRSALARNYAAAYAAARADLSAQLAQAGFARLFERSRLGSLDGLLSARRAVAEASKALKQYRGREAAIEQAYGDTLALVGHRLSLTGADLTAWDVRAGQRESPDAARLADQLLAQLDRVYGLLVAEDGHYQVNGDAITFGDSSAAARYGDLRASIQQRGAGDAPTIQQIARALGGRLPQERTE